VDALLASPELRGAAAALLGVLVTSLAGALIGEWRAGRDDGRVRQRERDDRRRAVRQRVLDETRAYLTADFDAMRRHVADGVNVVRPRRVDYPRVLIALIGERDAVAEYHDLLRSVFTSPPGGGNRALLARIDQVHQRVGIILSTQELNLADDEELERALISGFEELHDPLAPDPFAPDPADFDR
jgi:hypothetical protein